MIENTRLEADYVFIECKVIGTVIARKALEITGSATLIGDASYDELIDMHPRSRVCGKIEYRGDIDAAPRGMRDRVGTANGVELVKQRADMKFGRVNGNVESARDLFVRRPLGEQCENLELPWGQ